MSTFRPYRRSAVAGLLTIAVLAAVVSPAAAQQPSAEELAKANNPLADIKAFNLQNYYYPKLWEVDDEVANTFWLRAAAPTGPVLWRASLPVIQRPTGGTGFGDLQLFGAYLAVTDPAFSFGVGPQLSFPTAKTGFGPDVFQAGFAAVAFAAPSAAIQYGGLVTWQTDVNGDPDDPDDPKPNTSSAAIQPFLFWQLGGGTYLRMAPIWVFDLESDDYHVPFGVGIGKVLKSERVVYNLFIEPQFTMAHQGAGQPAFQIFTGVNLQFIN